MSVKFNRWRVIQMFYTVVDTHSDRVVAKDVPWETAQAYIAQSERARLAPPSRSRGRA